MAAGVGAFIVPAFGEAPTPPGSGLAVDVDFLWWWCLLELEAIGLGVAIAGAGVEVDVPDDLEPEAWKPAASAADLQAYWPFFVAPKYLSPCK